MDSPDKIRKWNAAELFFAILLTAGAIMLLAMIGDQVKYFSSKPFFKQPGLWTSIGLIGMVLSGILYILGLWISKSRLSVSDQSLSAELWLWVKSIEYLLWFMGYVLVVPWIGYLMASMALGVLLTIRLGYRKKKFYIAVITTTIAIVVIFKSLLLVKIPGGAVYELFPDSIRNFLILNL